MKTLGHVCWHFGTWRTRVVAAWLLTAAASAIWPAISPAAAQEYCVACTGPDVLYRCVIDGARPGIGSSLPLLCISALAKDGNHATCAISRGTGVIDCNGPIKHVAASPGSNVAPATTLPEPAPVPGAKTADPQVPKGDPKTVAEMLQRAKEQNDKSWEKTTAQIKSNNDKIGGFFAKSWTCLSSLFVRCNGQ